MTGSREEDDAGEFAGHEGEDVESGSEEDDANDDEDEDDSGLRNRTAKSWLRIMPL